MGEGSGAVAWLAGDVSGDGKGEIVQLWDIAGTLGMIVYGADGQGGYRAIFGSSDMGEGSGAVTTPIGHLRRKPGDATPLRAPGATTPFSDSDTAVGPGRVRARTASPLLASDADRAPW